jgi:hypothetical protein
VSVEDLAGYVTAAEPALSLSNGSAAIRISKRIRLASYDYSMVRPCFLILSRYFLIQMWLTIKT